MVKFREQLIELNDKWVKSSLNCERFAKLHGLTYDEMDMILSMVQSWENITNIPSRSIADDCRDNIF
jgi:hypothetical protein